MSQQSGLLEIAEMVRRECAATGRNPREVLQTLEDEGYIDFDEEGVNACLALLADEGQRS